MTETFKYRWVDKEASRTLLLLHGTGGDELGMIGLGEQLDPTANYLSLRGNSREEGTNRFFRRTAEGIFDEEDLHLRTKELHDFLLAAEQQEQIVPSRTIAVGFSNGANIAASLLLLYPGAVAGAILLRPMSVFEEPVEYRGPNSRVLVLSGSRDPIVPEARRAKLVEHLKLAGCEVTEYVLPATHDLTRGDLELSREWLASSEMA